MWSQKTYARSDVKAFVSRMKIETALLLPEFFLLKQFPPLLLDQKSNNFLYYQTLNSISPIFRFIFKLGCFV